MRLQTALMVGGVAAAGLLLLALAPRAAAAARGIATGENDLTRNATNAQGEPVSAYFGAGMLGTAGAAANTASGGWLATAGGWIGRTFYDLVNDDPLKPNQVQRATTDDLAQFPYLAP